MKTVIRKWFWLWDFEKEERWLNDMAAKGLVLRDVGYCRYVFEDAVPGAYQLRLELLENVPTHPESQHYIRFLEDTGAEYLGSVLRWVYLRKRRDAGNFDLFSDNASRIKHLNRMLAPCSILALSEIIIGMSNMSTYLLGRQFFFNLLGGILCLALGLFLGCGALTVYSKKRRLKKEQQLFE